MPSAKVVKEPDILVAFSESVVLLKVSPESPPNEPSSLNCTCVADPATEPADPAEIVILPLELEATVIPVPAAKNDDPAVNGVNDPD